jgi:hypothetical protein
MANIQSSARNLVAIARREIETMFPFLFTAQIGDPAGTVFVTDATSYPTTTALSVGPVIDFATASFVQLGRTAILTMSGVVDTMAGGTASTLQITLQSPDGVDLQWRLVPIGSSGVAGSGFLVSFNIYNPNVTKYWFKYRFTDVTGAPTAAIYHVKTSYVQFAENSLTHEITM